jgi:anti-anti-sigma factor
MNIVLEQTANGFAVQLSGRSHFHDYKLVEQLCQEIERAGSSCQSLIVDLRQVEFIDSSGLGLLLLLKEHCDRFRVRIHLSGAQGQVQRILHASRLNEIFGLPYA